MEGERPSRRAARGGSEYGNHLDRRCLAGALLFRGAFPALGDSLGDGGNAGKRPRGGEGEGAQEEGGEGPAAELTPEDEFSLRSMHSSIALLLR